MKISDKRKIKNIGFNEYSKSIHPISLLQYNEKIGRKVCPTKFYFEKNNFKMDKLCDKEDGLPIKKIKDNFLVPPNGLSIGDLLLLYDIESKEDLLKYIEDNPDKPFEFLNRFVNDFVRIYFDEMKKNNSIVENIVLFFEKKYIFGEINKKDSNLFRNEIKKFLNYWFDKNDKDQFDLNLLIDFKNYLSKRYESK